MQCSQVPLQDGLTKTKFRLWPIAPNILLLVLKICIAVFFGVFFVFQLVLGIVGITLINWALGLYLMFSVLLVIFGLTQNFPAATWINYGLHWVAISLGVAIVYMIASIDTAGIVTKMNRFWKYWVPFKIQTIITVEEDSSRES